MILRPTLPVAVPLIIIVNIAIFLLWQMLIMPGTEPTFMIRHFLVSWNGLTDGRFWTLLTAAFSQNMFWHLFLNMYVLNSFGPIMEETLGSARFIKFYLTAGIVSSMSHALVSAWLLKKPDLPAIGASGAISGVIILFSLLFPKQRVFIFGLIPMPALGAAFLFVGLDAWGLFAQAEGGGLPIGHGAHLGGALVGFAYFYFNFSRRPVSIAQRFSRI